MDAKCFLVCVTVGDATNVYCREYPDTETLVEAANNIYTTVRPDEEVYVFMFQGSRVRVGVAEFPAMLRDGRPDIDMDVARMAVRTLTDDDGRVRPPGRLADTSTETDDEEEQEEQNEEATE